ncbi:DMT family transporter [Amaricoccus sp.]|uniref:DMT family transporter n=1 Tax=Amaricoccus sp. TaxID=1872485 RepID=UPI001B79CBBA|nr:DMT family transporter [Amaricoccus sp.]MBP7240746.1 DMT family transporter [Amaricoccus sp.]
MPAPHPSGAAPAARPSHPLKAFAWMLGAIASFAAMAVAGREIQVEMNTFELMLYRSAIGFAVIAAIVLASGRPGEIVASRHPWLHVKRNAAHYLGQNLWFFAVTLIPLGQLAALEFTNPIWVVLLAPFFLGEAMTKPRLLAAGLGFVGVLIVAEPGVAPFGAGQAAALVAGLAFALNTIYTRKIMTWDPVLCVLFWMTLAQGFASLVLSMPGGIPVPSAAIAPWIAVVGLTGLSAHYCLTSALGQAPASVVAPMEFLRLPIVATLGMLVYHEPLRLAVFVGAAVIIVGNLVGLRAARRGAG